MFDLNQILSAALNAAVAEAVAPLVERIDRLEFALADRHQRLLVLEGALTDRVVALENNPAIGVDTTLLDRVVALEARVAVLAAELITTGAASDERIREIAEVVVEQAMDEHNSSYDHDDYDRHISDDDKHIDGDLDDAVRDAVSNLSFEVSVS